MDRVWLWIVGFLFFLKEEEEEEEEENNSRNGGCGISIPLVWRGVSDENRDGLLPTCCGEVGNFAFLGKKKKSKL